jgi:hypothetical protein
MSLTTANKMVAESLKQAGLTNPSGELLNRVRDEWLKRIVQDVLDRSQVDDRGYLESLHVRTVAIGEVNRARYKLPSDYDQELTVDLLDATTTGLSQSGSASSVTLASSEDITQVDAEGRFLLMRAGESKGQYRQIMTYNTTTKVAVLDASWNNGKIPAAGDTYAVIDKSYRVNREVPERMLNQTSPRRPGRPCEFSVYERELIFDRPLDKKYGISLWYYSNPIGLPLSDDTWGRILIQWMNVFTLGIKYRALQEADDEIFINVQSDYEISMAALLHRERDAGSEFVQFGVAV